MRLLDRRTFVGWLSALPLGRLLAARHTAPVLDVRPSALYQAPDGRRNLVRLYVSGLGAPAARARVTDRRGALVGTAGLVPLGAGVALSGEIWVPLTGPTEYQVDVEVGRDRAVRRRVRLVPPKRWTVYWLASAHTDIGYTDLQERAMERHRRNLDAALRRFPTAPEFRLTAEGTAQVLSYLENRAEPQADALAQAIRDGRLGWHALFANMLTGILDHETYARLVWPAGRLARERGLAYTTAQMTDVPGQPATFPTLLAASGVKYLASAPSAERAAPIGDLAFPQLYYWEGPDGSRVLHWRAGLQGEIARLGIAASPDDMGRRLSDWLLTTPVFLSRDWPYDVALVYGVDARPNALIGDEMVANAVEFGRRFAFPRLLPARAEDFFRDVERRFGPRIPVRRGDTGIYREEGAASTAAALAEYRAAQLEARAAEILALWDGRLDPERPTPAAEHAAMWRDLLLFGEHTWGAQTSATDPLGRQTIAQWAYKRRYLDTATAAARGAVDDGLLRLGRGTRAGRGRIVFNAGSWERSDVAVVPGGAGKTLAFEGRELPTVDLESGDALVLVRDVPPLGYLALAESDREPRGGGPVAEGTATEATAGGFTVALDPATGALRSLTGPDGRERVKTTEWSGLNQLLYVSGPPPDVTVAQARSTSTPPRRERLPGIGVRLIVDRALDGCSAVTTTVTLYDELPWLDIENRIVKTGTRSKEALYVAFPFAFTQPAAELEVPLGRMTVERDQLPGSNRDWYAHTHWVWLHEADDGVLWSGPDTPLVTFNDIVRGQWRRSLVPDGTLFAWAMNNYWDTNFAAQQPGPAAFRFRLSLLGPGDAAEPVRRGWAACDPLRVSRAYDNAAPGPLIPRDRALFVSDRNAMVIGAKPADDGDGAIVKLLDVAGQKRALGLYPAAYTYRGARRVNLVEQNGDLLEVGAEGRVAMELSAWGVSAARLFTPAEPAG